METFSALLAICTGKSPVTGEFPAHRPATRSFDVFFDLLLNKRLSKQWLDWWFEPSRPLKRHCNIAFTVVLLFYHVNLHCAISWVHCMHYSDGTRALWHTISQKPWLFVRQLGQANKNISQRHITGESFCDKGDISISWCRSTMQTNTSA